MYYYYKIRKEWKKRERVGAPRVQSGEGRPIISWRKGKGKRVLLGKRRCGFELTYPYVPFPLLSVLEQFLRSFISLWDQKNKLKGREGGREQVFNVEDLGWRPKSVIIRLSISSNPCTCRSSSFLLHLCFCPSYHHQQQLLLLLRHFYWFFLPSQ